MAGYPEHCITHNVPLVVLFGLGAESSIVEDEATKGYRLTQDQSTVVSTNLPCADGPVADNLIRCFDQLDARHAAWNSRPGKGKMGSMGFTYRRIGRVGQARPNLLRSVEPFGRFAKVRRSNCFYHHIKLTFLHSPKKQQLRKDHERWLRALCCILLYHL